METIHPISVEQWADNNKVDRRTAQRWAKEGKLPLIPRPIVLRGVDPSVTLIELVKAKRVRAPKKDLTVR